MSWFHHKSHDEIAREVSVKSLEESFNEVEETPEEQERQISNLAGYLAQTYSDKELTKDLKRGWFR
jgi:hypothetical protein